MTAFPRLFGRALPTVLAARADTLEAWLACVPPAAPAREAMSRRRAAEVTLMGWLLALPEPARISREGTCVVLVMLDLRAASSEGIAEACRLWVASARERAGPL